jgi:IS5 family transposase
VKLADEVDWVHFEEVFGLTYVDGVGRPGIPTRLMVALHYLKYALDLSDEQVVRGWLENPTGSTSQERSSSVTSFPSIPRR